MKTIVYISSLAIFLTVSAVFYCNYEGWTPEIAFGFAIVTLSTVGKRLFHIQVRFDTVTTISFLHL
jgi:hypothetical protein